MVTKTARRVEGPELNSGWNLLFFFFFLFFFLVVFFSFLFIYLYLFLVILVLFCFFIQNTFFKFIKFPPDCVISISPQFLRLPRSTTRGPAIHVFLVSALTRQTRQKTNLKLHFHSFLKYLKTIEYDL